MIRTEFINEKGIRDLNEDAVLFNDEHSTYGVFDGASSLTKYMSNDNKTGGYIAAHVAASTFNNAKGGLFEIAPAANAAIEQSQIDADVDTSTSLNRFGCTAAVVRIHDDITELFQCGDSIIIVRYRDGTIEAPLGYNDQDVVAMRLWRRYVDEGRQNVRELLQEEIVLGRERANIDYGTLNGDAKATEHFLTTKIATELIQDILIISDGMFIPKQDPDATEKWGDYFAIYDQSGLRGLYDYVRALELSDPDLTTYPRFKIHDDASAIAINL